MLTTLMPQWVWAAARGGAVAYRIRHDDRVTSTAAMRSRLAALKFE